MPYRSYYLDTEGELHRPADSAQIQQALDSWGILWVDVENTTEEDAGLLIDVFGFHPLAVERCIDEEGAPTTASERFVPSAVDPSRLATHLGRVVIRALTEKDAEKNKRRVGGSST